MNIEKIKNYNQKVLAVIGSVVVLIAILILISIIYFSISEIRRYYPNQEQGVFAEDVTDELLEENKRQQLTSYEVPLLTDTLNLIYIIPVSHKTLNEPEYIEEGIVGMINSNPLFESEMLSDKRYYKEYYGDFNNIIIYNQKLDSSIKLFDKRVNFSTIQTEYFKDDILVIIKVSEEDTFKDGVINLLDFKSLYLYSLSENNLKKISLKNTDIINYSFINNTKNILIRFGKDQNNDGKYDEYREPSIIMKYNYDKDELIPVVSDKINNELQKTLEGSKK